MTTEEVMLWQQHNDTFLSAAVAWLRMLLTRNVPADARPATPDAQVVTPEPTDAELAAALEKMREAEAVDPPPALTLLAARLGLSPFERDVVLLCIATELDTRIATLCARVQDDPARTYPTFALAMTVFAHAAWEARSPERPLRRWRLIEIAQAPAQPLTTSALRADERIVNYVKGLTHLDERIVPFLAPMQDFSRAGQVLPPSQQAVAASIAATLQHHGAALRPVMLLGADSDSKQGVAIAAARQLGISLYRLGAEMLPSHATDIETFSTLWQRETFLLPVGLFIDAHDVDRSSESVALPLRRFLTRTPSLLFVDTRDVWPVPQGSHVFDVEKPTPAEQRELWLQSLGETNGDAAAHLAGQFNLSGPTIQRIGSEVRAGEGNALPRAWARTATEARVRIGNLAERITPKASWDDLVLPQTEKDLLRQIAAQVAARTHVYDEWGFRARMSRGFSVSALFAGESGTGKTMAAEVIANELDLALYRVDLSAVISKWVGESEKNLERIFSAADGSNAIVFCDEADALFGKRTEVQHSQDRFANIEINYLLQRMESYRGLVILATNLKNAIDAAFLRRLRFVVNFPFPGAGERRAMWERAFPPELPTDVLDFDRLSRLPLTGGSVHNVALAAAFIAASRGTRVTMPVLLEAARTELVKLDKRVNEADFRWREPELVIV